jgi:hypothetical protein
VGNELIKVGGRLSDVSFSQGHVMRETCCPSGGDFMRELVTANVARQEID